MGVETVGESVPIMTGRVISIPSLKDETTHKKGVKRKSYDFSKQIPVKKRRVVDMGEQGRITRSMTKARLNKTKSSQKLS